MRLALAICIGAAAIAAAAGDRLMPAPVDLPPIPPFPSHSIEDRIVLVSLHHILPPSIALDRAWNESRFLPGLRSATGDHGVMQLNERYFPGALTLSEDENIDMGVGFLAQLWRCYGDAPTVHHAYRFGPRGRCRETRP